MLSQIRHTPVGLLTSRTWNQGLKGFRVNLQGKNRPNPGDFQFCVYCMVTSSTAFEQHRGQRLVCIDVTRASSVAASIQTLVVGPIVTLLKRTFLIGNDWLKINRGRVLTGAGWSTLCRITQIRNRSDALNSSTFCMRLDRLYTNSWFGDEKWTWKHPNTFLSWIAQSHCRGICYKSGI